ncbi:hypothetical protein LEP1GSC100_1992 [Leptospira interrogans serovar Bataviae str. UI 08561]|nr:hypothetical protein LEP1GSC100_1992 [Leptospira interrogans serovar Bataviae str. UI 08561]
MVAYKSVANGGPAVGTETLENANWHHLNCPNPETAGVAFFS